MRTLAKILAVFIVIGAIAIAVAMRLTSDARDTARAFVLESSAGDYAAARARLHPTLAEQWTEALFAEGFAGTQPYTEVSFSSLEASGGVTNLAGTAETATGCSSKVSFELVNSQIIAFDIAPLCRQ